MKRVHIVAGVIFNTDKSEIFITRRMAKQHQGGLWEFPGGKVEINESIEQALTRELNEEIGIQSKTLTPYQHLDFDYEDKALTFDFMLVTEFSGTPFGREGQQGQWVSVKSLSDYPFPAANQPILERVIKEFT